MPTAPISQIHEAAANARRALLDARNPQGHWIGRLASSALATATAAFALTSSPDPDDAALRHRAYQWLADHQNPDGGFGDTPLSKSNLSATLLAWSSLADTPHTHTTARIESWLHTRLGRLTPDALTQALADTYGRDQSFAAPILTMTALDRRLSPNPWPRVPQLPFELAALPRSLWRRVGLPVVSYALPALIAIGLVRHHHAPTRNPLLRALRNHLRPRLLRLLESIQPPSGGFLEAQPLSAFVAMSLAAANLPDHPVVAAAHTFLRQTARPDGSWPVDTNLATWLTSLAVKALAASGSLHPDLTPHDHHTLTRFLLDQHWTQTHPYTAAPPGGWGWTNLPGSVPDADDTAAATLALHHLAPNNPDAIHASQQGLQWLENLQNRDGGIPTFCRGWGKLPFDRSAPDLTAHAIAAWSTDNNPRHHNALQRATRYLARAQRPDGSFLPLWFGNEHTPDQTNPVYGSAQVLAALAEFPSAPNSFLPRSLNYLLASQRPDGAWPNYPHAPATIEETALALTALATTLKHHTTIASCGETMSAIRTGLAWLLAATQDASHFPPAPIGLYFARLWYYEDLYPLLFTTTALESIRTLPLA